MSMNYISLSFPGGSDGKASACNAGDPGSIPGWGRSPGEGNGNPVHPYMTTGKTIVFTRWTFIGKIMSLLFNMLSRLVNSI